MTGLQIITMVVLTSLLRLHISQIGHTCPREGFRLQCFTR
jgi:hypothetical protein